MKKNIFLALIIAFPFFFLNSCKKDDTEKTVNDEGLTEEIVNLVPASILDEIESLGMPIYGGVTPPNIENSYVASPFVLTASNIQSDQIGHTYSNYYVKFYNQDHSELSISMNYLNGPESGTGIGSYIVGENDKFSVFCEVNAEVNGSTAKFVHIISGEWTTNGIQDLYFSNFMLDNNGNPTGYWIENGAGRVIYDSDGFSPITDSFRITNRSDKKGIGAKSF